VKENHYRVEKSLDDDDDNVFTYLKAFSSAVIFKDETAAYYSTADIN
jgi:hypothetical protein